MRNISMTRVLTFCLIVISLVFSQRYPFSKNCHAEPVSASLQGEITILEDKRYVDLLLTKISEVRKDILISMYVFKTTDKRTNPANRIMDALIKAAGRGVDVKVLLEREYETGSSINSDNEYTARRLRQGGVKVFFDSPRQRTHAKAIVIDRRFTFIGSHNLTSSALQYNRELSLMIDSVEVAGETARYIEEMIRKTGGL